MGNERTMRDTERNWAWLTMAIVSVIALLMWLSVLIWPAGAVDNGQYEGVDPQIRSWFNGVKSKQGVPCCSMADGHRTDFKVDAWGHYFVPIADVPSGPNPVWILVPPEAVITSQGNPNDAAIVWYVRQEPPPLSGAQPTIHIRCFVPVGGV